VLPRWRQQSSMSVLISPTGSASTVVVAVGRRAVAALGFDISNDGNLGMRFIRSLSKQIHGTPK
jgi:hypothetical protein